MDDERQEDYHTVGIDETTHDIRMKRQIIGDRLREILGLQADAHLVAEQRRVIASDQILVRHALEQRCHAPLGSLERSDDSVEDTRLRLMPYPVFLAFVAKVVLDLMPTLGEDGADLNLIGRIDDIGIFLRQGLAEVFDILFGQGTGDVETLRTESRIVGSVDALFHHIATAEKGRKHLDIVREIDYDTQSDDVLHLRLAFEIRISLDAHLVSDGLDGLDSPEKAEHQSAFADLAREILLKAVANFRYCQHKKSLAMSYNELLLLRQSNIDISGNTVYWFSDHNYDIPEDGVYTTRDFYKAHPEECESFAKATQRGWEWCRQHPEEALDIVMQYVADNRILTNRVIQEMMLKEVLRLNTDPTNGHTTYELKKEKVEEASKLLYECQLIKRPITYSDITK